MIACLGFGFRVFCPSDAVTEIFGIKDFPAERGQRGEGWMERLTENHATLPTIESPTLSALRIKRKGFDDMGGKNDNADQ